MTDSTPKKSTGYQVDVSALEQTVAKLNAVAAELGPTADRAAYQTTIGTGTLGTGFEGATGLLGTHDTMQSWIAEMVGQLQNFIEEYGGQTKQVAANYSDLETQTTEDMYR
ncbi:hypothetical protein GXW82_39470 [Streptacidiphilus sp. 4-A2]|nr:hypothetical protein [Streptacidiphilus sp. 4-A2]